MDVKTFQGDFFEIGKQLGELYKKNGMNFDGVKIDPVIYKDQKAIYEKHYPEMLDEFRGMAVGGNFDENKLIYDFITLESNCYRKQFGLDKACTIFGYKKGKDLFVGRNYDWIPEAGRIFETYKVINPKKYSFIAVTDMAVGDLETAKPEYLFYYPDDVINDQGLFVGITFAFADQWSYGISCYYMTKLIAETCRTVQEAINVFNNVPICCPKNFFIADKYGDMAVVEHTSKKFRIVTPKDNVLIQTNHYVDPELAQEDTVLKRIPQHNTYIRYYETLQKIGIEKDKFDHDSIIEILGRPGSYTCQNFPGIKTIWTLALYMTNGRYSIYWDLFEERKSEEIKI